MIKMILATARDRSRLAEISGVFIHYGLQDVLGVLGLSGIVDKLRGANRPRDRRALPERLCAALEELGPAFIKLGQIMATRTDLLEPTWTDALSQLHTSARPLPWSELQPHAEAALGAPVQTLFSWFDQRPLASASIAQIHRARLPNGDDVVVKIQRPFIEETIRADLRLLRYLAGSVEQQSTFLARFHPLQLVLYLENAIRQELDFCYEAASGAKIYQQFAGSLDVVIPQIYWELTSPTVMVQEYLAGTAPVSNAQLAAEGYDGAILARKGSVAFMKMLLENRLYHADPHPGNVMALPGNRVGFIDFGMVGHLSETRRDELLSLLYAISEHDASGIIDALIVWCDPDSLDITELELAASYFLEKQGSMALQLGKALTDMLATAREFRLPLPPDLVLLFKALITADGVLQRLDPAFDIVAVLKPMLRTQMARRYSHYASRKRMLKLGNQLLDSGETLPQTLRLLMQRLRHGRLQADINLTNITQLGCSLERAASTLALAIVIAAIVIVVTPWLFRLHWTLFGVPFFQMIGLFCYVVGSFWLLWRLWRR